MENVQIFQRFSKMKPGFFTLRTGTAPCVPAGRRFVDKLSVAFYNNKI